MDTKSDITQDPIEPTPSTSTTPKKKRTTMSKKANLIFPVARVDRLLREGNYSTRYSKKASVYLASVLECLSGLIIKKVGQETLNAGRIVITPNDVHSGIRQDVHINKLLGDPKGYQIAGTK